ncbi:thiamine biosynthesis lipoprotein [Enhydrobacter aerosaccus]|uniref:FAD:protein FMN transferase n=1 Tax=Enhydrobacter aerosaccus TaxID=225324 RepID=A0A1T4SVV6_9HYPH|nr:FAD:protein FMN transferase [Enhydrobacter aerosaccus]SKA32031.1 thiamine biosynthesis lipoprotein [Enhydrobacter aerosaccus]
MTFRLPRPGRRRFLQISASLATMGLPAAQAAPQDQEDLHHWQGIALGADASLTLYHPDRAAADNLIATCLAEVARLEKVFSLYRPDSAISRLNRDGHLDAPPLELVELLSLSRQIGDATVGAFDPTVQPLWDLYARHFAAPDANPAGPSRESIRAVRERVGLSAIDVGASEIRFGKPEMAITLNGIAQGYITDRIVELLKANGMTHALADMGEVRALGTRPDGTPWSVGLEDAALPGHIASTIPLADRAVSTSGGYGLHFDGAERFNHIFDPHTGETSDSFLAVSVVARSAALADGLSTAFSVMSLPDMRTTARRFDLQVHVTALDGSRFML